MSTPFDALLKTIIIGDSGVGKSSLLHRYIDDKFTTETSVTVGVDFKFSILQRGGRTVKLQVWDTAGQERFSSIGHAFYRGAHCILLVYDVTRKSTLENVRRWLEEVTRHGPPGVPIILVGNKTDLPGRVVSFEEGNTFASDNGISEHIEASAKTASNVEEAFLRGIDTALSTGNYNKPSAPQLRPKIDLQPSCYGSVAWLLGY